MKTTEILFTLLVGAIAFCSAQQQQQNYVEYFTSDCSGPVYSTTAFGQCTNQNFLQFSQKFQCNVNNTFSIITYDAQNCQGTFFAPTAISYPANKCIYMSGPPTTNQTIYGIGYCNGGQPSASSGGAANSGSAAQQSSAGSSSAPQASQSSSTASGQKSESSRMVEFNLYACFFMLTVLFFFLQ